MREIREIVAERRRLRAEVARLREAIVQHRQALLPDGGAEPIEDCDQKLWAVLDA